MPPYISNRLSHNAKARAIPDKTPFINHFLYNKHLKNRTHKAGLGKCVCIICTLPKANYAICMRISRFEAHQICASGAPAEVAWQLLIFCTHHKRQNHRTTVRLTVCLAHGPPKSKYPRSSSTRDESFVCVYLCASMKTPREKRLSKFLSAAKRRASVNL
jgi:hypothetical protein